MVRAAKLLSPTLNEHDLVYQRCQEVINEQGTIDDSTAKVIATWFVCSTDTATFANSGAISCPTDLFRQFLPSDPELGLADDMVLQLLELYLHSKGPRTAVEGWNLLWVG